MACASEYRRITQRPGAVFHEKALFELDLPIDKIIELQLSSVEALVV